LVGHLRGICLPLGYALVRYKQADALELPFADGTFDVV
jgi:ubiquinone/menaquinone biosynthesis C-methylase UbiE